jgi:hypothetical protein
MYGFLMIWMGVAMGRQSCVQGYAEDRTEPASKAGIYTKANNFMSNEKPPRQLLCS